MNSELCLAGVVLLVLRLEAEVAYDMWQLLVEPCHDKQVVDINKWWRGRSNLEPEEGRI
jgi:hypothetical protein